MKNEDFFSDAAIADVLEEADPYKSQSRPTLARRWEKSHHFRGLVSNAVLYQGESLHDPVSRATRHRKTADGRFPKPLLRPCQLDPAGVDLHGALDLHLE